MRGKDGRLRLMRTAKDAFLTREWLAADADMRVATDASLSDGVSCDEAGCVVQASDGSAVALVLQPRAFADDCTRAAIIVTARQPPPDCAALVFDRDSLRRQGTLGLRKTGDGYAIIAIRPQGVDRPWSRAVAEADPETPTSARRLPARPVDATPAESDLQAED